MQEEVREKQEVQKEGLLQGKLQRDLREMRSQWIMSEHMHFFGKIAQNKKTKGQSRPF